MEQKQLESALLANGIPRPIAQMIAVMALSPNIERREDGWLIPVSELDSATPSKRTQQLFIERLRSLLAATVKVHVEEASMTFPVVASIQQARDSQVLLYAFSSEFKKWAALPAGTSNPLH